MKRLVLFIGFMLFTSSCFGAPTSATQISVPNSFNSGTVIQSSKANDNFNEVQSKYNTHNHIDVTQLGTITTGTWQATALSTQYGGTGQDFSAASSGSIILFNATGTMAAIPNGVDGQVLSISGTSPKWQTTVVKDAILTGFEVVIEQPDAARCIVNGGTLYNNITQVDKTTGTVLTLATVSDWSSGSTLSITNNWNLIGVSATGQVSLLGNITDLYANTSVGVEATGAVVGLYAYETDGSATKQYWRIIGSIWEDGSSQIDRYFQESNQIMWDVPVDITTLISAGAWSSAVSCSAGIPIISQSGIFGCKVTGTAIEDLHFSIRPNGSTWTTNVQDGLYQAGVPVGGLVGQRLCKTDNFQQIQHQEESDDNGVAITVEGFFVNIR